MGRWMTKTLFNAWTVMFVSWVSKYRGRFLKDNYPDDFQKITLFIDSRRSRAKVAAMKLMRDNNIEVITFKAHTTHITQPFDKVVAAPLKVELKKNFYNAVEKYRVQFPGLEDIGARAKERLALIYSLLDAIPNAMNLSKCAIAFQSAGLYPFDSGQLLKSPFIPNKPDPIPPLAPETRPTDEEGISLDENNQQIVTNRPFIVDGSLNITEKVLTRDECLKALYYYTSPYPTVYGIPLPSYDFRELRRRVTESQNIVHGMILSKLPRYCQYGSRGELIYKSLFS